MKRPTWLTKQRLNQGSIALVAVGALAGLIGLSLWAPYAPPWSGIGAGETVTKSEKRDSQGKLLETTKTTTGQDAKTLWDWLSLLGVPVSLAILGYSLQQLQQDRAEQQAKVEKEIAESHQREEALQNYLDRLSELLIDKNLIAIATRLPDGNTQPQEPSSTELLPENHAEREMVNAAKDVIRARTLSILRRLGQDGERKGDVIQFLIEAEVISKLKLDLSNADLSNANLIKANLSEFTLRNANLTNAKLCGVNLKNADLSGANLVKCDLSGALCNNTFFSGADLSDAKLINANFTNVDFIDAKLTRTNLSGVKDWTEEELSTAKLSQTTLPEGCNLNPNRDLGGPTLDDLP